MLVVEPTFTLAGRMFKRRQPLGDAGDTVTLLGAMNVGNATVGPVIEVVLSSATFGAVPSTPPWQSGDGSTTTCDGDAFAALYTELDPAERTVLAIEQAAESEAASAKSAERESPWRRS